jgi:hypothetical protein
MTMYYTAREERTLAEEQDRKSGPLNAIELFMCADGNYRDAESKARYDDMRHKLIEQYRS